MIKLWGVAVCTGITTFIAFSFDKVSAQPFPIADDTLGAERTNVVEVGNQTVHIQGGATRGSNLFHSFSEFGMGDNSAAYFVLGSDAISNIFARVTGERSSDIFGTLGTCLARNCSGGTPSSNLYLINPNGIVFGPNSRLDLGGSFAATTADGIAFGTQGAFTAFNPMLPSSLLSVDPSAFLFNSVGAGGISHASRANAGLAPSGNFSTFGLRVPDGENFLLLGGDVEIDSGGIVAFGGHIGIGGVAAEAAVPILLDAGKPTFILDDTSPRANITLTNDAGLIVAAGGQGSVSVYGNNINLLDDSSISAGILRGVGTETAQAGDVILDATGAVTLAGPSAPTVENDVNADATGNSGAVIIRAESLSMTDRAVISSDVAGNGNSGGVLIDVREQVSLTQPGDLSGGGQAGTLILSRVWEGGEGNSGNIEITAGSLLVSNAQLTASTRGQGDSGNVIISVRDRAEFVRGGDIFTEVTCACETRDGLGGRGDAGDIIINAKSILLDSAANIRADTEAQGNGGNITLTAREDIVISGESDDFTTGIFSQVETDAVGEGGNISVMAEQLQVTGDGRINTRTQGRGDAGNIDVRVTGTVLVNGGALLNSSVEEGAVGEGGDIILSAGSLEVSDDAQLTASTSGQGSSGDVVISIRDRAEFIRGGDIFTEVTCACETSSGMGGRGDAGDITINARSILLDSGANIRADTEAQGNGGSITLTARENFVVGGESEGSTTGVFSQVETDAVGNGGDIFITAGQVYITDDGEINTRVQGRGDAGRISIVATDEILIDSSRALINSRVERYGIGDGGDIQLRVQSGDLMLQNGAQILTNTQGLGNAGNVAISVPAGTVQLDGFLAGADGNIYPSGIFSSVESGAVGDGGDIQISSHNLSLTNAGELVASTSGMGRAGDINLNIDNAVLIDGEYSGIFSTTQDAISISEVSSDAGQLLISSQDLSFQANGTLPTFIYGRLSDDTDVDLYRIYLNGNRTFSATTVGLTDTDTALFLFDADGRGIYYNDDALGSDSFQSTLPAGHSLSPQVPGVYYLAVGSYANRPVGSLGDIFEAGSFTDVLGPAEASISLTGWNGEGYNNGTYTIALADSSASSMSIPGGDGGSINLTAHNLTISDAGQISVRSNGDGKAGGIDIGLTSTLRMEDGDISASANSNSGGNINIAAASLQMLGDSDIQATSGGISGGNITISADAIVALDDSDILAYAPRGQGGNITFDTQGLLVDPDSQRFWSVTDISDLDQLDGNQRVDVNASGAISGEISGIVDISFLQNSLEDLDSQLIGPDNLIANSCIVVNNTQRSSSGLRIDASEIVPPTHTALTVYPIGNVSRTSDTNLAQLQTEETDGYELAEPQGAYQLADGRLVLSRECS